MKKKVTKWRRPALFTLGGAMIGLAYYYFVGCASGGCVLTANPLVTAVYTGFTGWLLSGVFGRGCCGSCNTQ